METGNWRMLVGTKEICLLEPGIAPIFPLSKFSIGVVLHVSTIFYIEKIELDRNSSRQRIKRAMNCYKGV